MGKRLRFSRWLVLALVIAALVAPLATPGLLQTSTSPQAALAQDGQADQTDQTVNTGDDGQTAIPTDETSVDTGDTSDQTGDTGDQTGDTGDQTGDTGDQTGDTGDQTGDTGDMDGDGTGPAQPPTEVVDEGQDGGDTVEPSETVAPSDTPTESAPVEVAADEVVIPAALPENVLNFTCIVDPATPDQRTIFFDVNPGGPGYGDPTVTVSLTDVNGNAVNPSPPMPSNPYTGTGSWQFGPVPGIAGISADASYPIDGGGVAQASLQGQCVPAATRTPTVTPVPPTATNTPTETPEGWTPSPTNTRTPTNTPTETPEGWTPSPTNTRVPSNTPTASNTPTETPEGWTASPTNTRTPSLTPTFRTTGTPIPLGDFRFTCGTSNEPGAAIYGLQITNLGAGITAVVSWTLIQSSGPPIYGSATVPPATNPLLLVNGKFVNAYANAVYYSGDEIVAVANVQGQCEVEGGPTWTPSNTPTNTPEVTDTPTSTNTPENTATATSTNTPVNTATATSTNTPENTATSTSTDTPTNTATATSTNTPTNTPTATNTPSPIVPVAPTVTANNCVGGKPVASTITPAVTPGLNYVVTQLPTSGNGWTYKVTATIVGSGLTWGDLAGTGWTQLDSTTATFADVAPPKPCVEVIPTTPDANDGVCTGGAYTPPSVTAVQGEGYTAQVTQQPNAGNNWTYIVTATITDGHSWDDLTGSGWKRVSDSVATYTSTVDPKPCTPLVPTAPDATDGVCTGGAWTAPTVAAVQGDGYTAVVTQTPNEGNGWTYIVTATIKDGYAWGDLASGGWAKSSDSVATFTKTVNPNLCTPLVPATPAATDGVCTGGVWTAPTVAAVPGEGYTAEVTQTPNEGNGWTYIVTATITDGYAWGDLAAGGWAKSSDSVATYTNTVEPNLCTPLVPATPAATDGVCTGGVWTAPTVEAVQGEGYTAVVTQTPNEGNGWTYIVTATIKDGYAWGDLASGGWAKSSDSVATFTKTVEPNLCTPLVPATPAATDGVCTGGAWTAPTVAAVQGEGYTAEVTQTPNEGNGWTYIVTATIKDGYAWGDLASGGWAKSSDSVATFTKTVNPNLCVETLPTTPDAVDGVCTGGTWTAPYVIPFDGIGNTAAVTQQPNAGNNWTYVVTATIGDGYAWGDLASKGWTKSSDSVATYTGTVNPNLCTEVSPPRPAPKVNTNVCEGGKFIPPVIVPGKTTGITYTVVQQPTAKNRWTYIVTATIDEDGYAWGDLSGTGWTAETPTFATITGTVVIKSCYVPKPHGPHGPKGPGAVSVLPSTGTGSTSDSMFTLFGVLAMAAASAAAAGLILRRKNA